MESRAGGGKARVVRRRLALRVRGRAREGERAGPPLLPSTLHRAGDRLRREERERPAAFVRPRDGEPVLRDAPPPAPERDRPRRGTPDDPVLETRGGSEVSR